jgi:hypothetical protein
MSFKRKVLATVATLTLAGGVVATSALTAGTARAASNPCGPFCINTMNKQTGRGYYMDVYRQGNRIGQPIIMFRGSNADPALDFTISDLVTQSFPFLPYTVSQLATLGGVTFAPATLAQYGSSYVVEFQYAPYGVNSGLCVGVLNAPTNGEGVTLQNCGLTPKTLWIINSSNPLQSFIHGWTALVNGANANFSHQYVLSYPINSFPTDLPRPQLYVHTVQTFSSGFPRVQTNQLWRVSFGRLH